MSEKEQKGSVRIIVRADGVDHVQLCGMSWDNEAEARRVYDLIAPFIQQIDRFIRKEGSIQ